MFSPIGNRGSALRRLRTPESANIRQPGERPATLELQNSPFWDGGFRGGRRVWNYRTREHATQMPAEQRNVYEDDKGDSDVVAGGSTQVIPENRRTPSGPPMVYICDNEKLGCDDPVFHCYEKLGSHKRDYCLFRYYVKCVVDDCEKRLIPVGHLENHFRYAHDNCPEFDLANTEACKGPFMVYCDSVCFKRDETTVPLIFFSEHELRITFLLVAMRTLDYIYFWIYKFAKREVNMEDYKGSITLCPSFINADNFEKVRDLAVDDAIHDIAVPVAEVIQTSRLIRIPFLEFYRKYISHYKASEYPDTEDDRYFYHLNVNIQEVKRSVEIVSTVSSNVDVVQKTIMAEPTPPETEFRKATTDPLAASLASSLESLPYSIINAERQRRRQQRQMESPP